MNLLTITFTALIAGALLSLADAEPPKGEVMNKAELFDLRDVRLTEGPFLEAQQTDRAYLLALEPDRLLAGFREEAGLAPKAQKYPGWESRGIAGHTLGHYLSAISLMWQATGDAQLRERVRYIVAELAECQQKSGDGYVGAIPNGHRGFREIAEGRLNVTNPFTLNDMWVPWYTEHKVLAGLVDAYVLCDEPRAREVAVNFADWCVRTIEPLTDEQMQTMLRVEHGGMADALAEVYSITSDAKHLAAAKKFRHTAVFEPAAAGRDALDGVHGNTQIPKFIGYERIYKLTGERSFGDAARNFWTFVARDRSFANGGHGAREHFFAVDHFNRAVLEPAGPETCNTYNMLKLTEQLFAEQPDAKLADFYERALLNHILPSERPGNPGELVYYTTMRPGGFRTYSSPFADFWCCVGSGMENHGKYGRFIYAHEGSKLLVNLFIPSQLKWDDVTVTQTTTFPAEPRTQIAVRLAKPKTFSIAVRYPMWIAAGQLKLRVNGETVPVTAGPGEYATVSREWKDGDVLSADLPMSVRVEPLPHSSDYVSLFFGPMLLAAPLGREGMQDVDFTGQFARQRKMLSLADVPVILASPDQVAAHVGSVPGMQSVFQITEITATKTALTLRPFYELHDQRYEVYFPIMTKERYQQHLDAVREEQQHQAALAARVIDEVGIGEQQSEVDHHLQSEHSRTGGDDDRWRDATEGGYFSYQLKTLADQPMTLRCRFWGSDSGRKFAIQIDGKALATQVLNSEKPGEFFDVEYAIPQDQTRGKTGVTIRFQAAEHSIAGGLFKLAILRAEPTDNR